jgi:hypothetical protein
LPEEQTKAVPAWLAKFEDVYRSQTILISLVKGLSPSKAKEIDAEGRPGRYWMLLEFSLRAGAVMIVAGALATVWWYVVVHQQAAAELAVTGVQQLGTPELVDTAATPAELGPGPNSTSGSGASRLSARCCRSVTTGGSTPSGSIRNC